MNEKQNDTEKLIRIAELINAEFLPDLPSRLNGIILKKAEAEKDFYNVYTKAFEKMNELKNYEEIHENEFLFILGDVGG